MTTWDAVAYDWDDANCGWDGALGAVLAFITVESGGSQLVPVGSDYAPVVAGAYDGIGAPMAGIQIFMFAPNFPGQPGGTFPDGTNYNIQTTDATGRCTFEPLTANALPGTLACYIADNAAGAPNVNFVLTQATAEPAAVQIVAGSPQSTRVAAAYPQQLTVRVADAFGNLLPGVDVAFRSPTVLGQPAATFPGGAATFAATTTGGTNPTATAPAPTANTVAGPVALTCTVAGSAATAAVFDLTNLPGPAVVVLAVAGSPQSTQVSTAFQVPLVAAGADAYGNPVAGQTIRFAAPDPSPSATFFDGTKQATVVADATGAAAAPQLTADDTIGTFRVVATMMGSPAEGVFLLSNMLQRDDLFDDSGWEFVSPNGEGIRLRVLRGQHGRLMPTVELWEEEVPGQPGHRFLGARHAARDINLPCLIESPVVGLEALRQIARVLDPTRGIGSLRCRLADGTVRQIGATYAGGLDATREETPGALWAPLVFHTPDPYWTDGVTQTDTAPVGAAAMEVVNDGDHETWPVIEVVALNPNERIGGFRMVNTETGHKIEISAGFTFYRAVFDSRPGHKSVLLDGVNSYRRLSADSDLWPLVAGSQVITMAIFGPTQVLFTTTITWARRFLSI